MSSRAIDPITLEVMRNAYYSIADEMIAALIRASYSTNIKDRRDTSCAIYTGSGDVVVVAQSEIGTPLHLGTMHSAVQSAMAVYPFDELEPGDAIATNTPYPAGPGHLNDLCLISPIFHEGKLLAISANQAHHVDMGGFAPGSMPFGVTEIFQEGLQIPPVRLFHRGEIVQDLWKLIAQNVRTETEVRGDLMAQYAAGAVGARRLCELADRYGFDTISRYLDEMLDYSERRMRAALTRIPDGVYTFEDIVEGDGITTEPFTIRLRLESRGETARADFSESDDACAGPLNCRWPSVAACVYYVLKALLDPELPPNAGAYRPIEIVVRDGSLLSATYPNAVCNANIVTTQRIVDVLLGALSQAVPDLAPAASSGTMNLLNIGGMDDRTGVYYNYVETYAGGPGRHPRPRRHGRRPESHDQHPERAGRVDRDGLPAQGRDVRAHRGLRGRGKAPRRRRAPAPGPGGRRSRASDPQLRPRRGGPLGPVRRTSGVALALLRRRARRRAPPAPVQGDHDGPGRQRHRYPDPGRRRLRRPGRARPPGGAGRRCIRPRLGRPCPRYLQGRCRR